MKRKLTLLILLLLFLTGCNQAPSKNVSELEETQEIVKASDDYYKMMVPLSESSIRGITYGKDDDAYIDYDNMEEELLEISKEFLNTNELFYEPGQILDVDDVNLLLARETDNNSYALNPPKTSSPEDSAIYVNTIIEQDFYTLSEENKKVVDTIALGFGIDTTYKQGEKEVTITDDKIQNFITQYVSSQVSSYIKEEKELDDVRIICAFYKETTDNNLPGSYYTYGEIAKGEEAIKEVKVKNVEYKSYPDYNTTNDKINNEIISFTSNISNYFENYTGVSAVAKYEDNKIKQLNIDLVVDSYSKAEIEAFSQYVKDNISSEMKNIDLLEIDIILPSMEILGIIEYQNGKLIVDYVKK